MKFHDLLSRVGDDDLQNLLGGPTIRLLGLLDPRAITPEKLGEILLQLRSCEDLLHNRASRALLLYYLRLPEANQLANVLDLKRDGDPFPGLRSIDIRRGSERERLLFA